MRMPCHSCVSYVIVFEMSLTIILTALFLVFHLSSHRADPESYDETHVEEVINGASSGVSTVAMAALDAYGFPLAHLCIAFLYGLYRRFTLFNVTLVLLKYIPTGLYMYKTLKGVYVTSRERIKQKQIEVEDIQLQIKIVNTKLCMRDAEFMERAEQLRRCAERLRMVRARVRELIASDDTLRHALESAAPWGDEAEVRVPATDDEGHAHSPLTSSPTSPLLAEPRLDPASEREFIITLLKELKSAELKPERPPENMECGEHLQQGDELSTPENSVYSSLSDGDAKQDCRVKIVKVTNVYKFAYLKHYMKQKRLRRATQQALLKKKIESIKKLLEGWQKSLNAVINSKLMYDAPIDLASQAAMGDFSKPNLRESSDSESDLRTNNTDALYDDYNLSWNQPPYKSYGFTYDDISQPGVTKEICESQEFNNDIIKYSEPTAHRCELFILPEETSSQVAIEEARGEAGGEQARLPEMVTL